MLMQYLTAEERREYKRGDYKLYSKEESLYGDTTPDGRSAEWYADGMTTCAYCGDPIPNMFRRKYCSQRCANDAYMQRRRIRQISELRKVCPVCGNSFIGSTKAACYCSNACKQKAYRERRKALP